MNANSDTADVVTLDLRGLNCPLPVLKIKKTLASLECGKQIHATTTDPMSTIDISVFCEREGHMLIETRENTDADPATWEFLIEHG